MPDGLARARRADLIIPRVDSAYELSRWLSRNDADAEDIVQDALEPALRYASRLQGTRALKVFAARLARSDAAP